MTKREIFITEIEEKINNSTLILSEESQEYFEELKEYAESAA